MTPNDTQALREKLERAHVELCNAVARQFHGDAALKMSIPARLDHDTDLVIGGALLEALAALSPAPGAITQEQKKVCPFCGEGGFDIRGLREHLIEWCRPFHQAKFSPQGAIPQEQVSEQDKEKALEWAESAGMRLEVAECPDLKAETRERYRLRARRDMRLARGLLRLPPVRIQSLPPQDVQAQEKP